MLVDEIKQRLMVFLEHPESGREFGLWFSSKLREVHTEADPSTELFAHAVQLAFSDAAAGFLSKMELRSTLSALAHASGTTVVPIFGITSIVNGMEG